MSDAMCRFSRPPTGRRSGRPGGAPRELIFSTLHPAYQSLRDKSNILTADEAVCQEQKELVKEYDAQLERLFDPSKPNEDLATCIIRRARAEAMAKIRESKRHRSTLIIELAQAQQAWEMVNKPSQEEEEELSDRLEQEFEQYWNALKTERAFAERGTTSADSKGYQDLDNLLAGMDDSANAGKDSESTAEEPADEPDSNELQIPTPSKCKTPSIRSVDITSLLASSEDSASTTTTERQTLVYATAESQPPTSPKRARNKRAENSTISLDAVVSKVSGTMRAGREQVNSVLCSIGNLRQRRRKGDRR